MNIRIVILLIFSFSLKASIPDSLQIVIEKSKTVDEKLRNLNLLADYYLTADYVKARKIAFEALKLSKNAKKIKNISDIYINIGNSYYYEGLLDSTLAYYKKSYELFLKTNDTLEIASAINRLGLIFRVKNDYQKAYSYFMQSLELNKKINNTKGIADLYNNLGIISERLGKEEEAIKYYQKSLRLYKTLPEKRNYIYDIASVTNNIASYYSNREVYDSAFFYIRKAIHLHIKLNNKVDLCTSYNNYGHLFYFLGNTDSALFYFNKSLNLAKEINVKKEEFFALKNLASIYRERKQYAIAKEMLYSALAIQLEVGSPYNLSEIYLSLSNLFSDLKMCDSSFFYYKKHVVLKDSVLSAKMYAQIHQIKENYEILQRDKKIILLKKNAEIKNTYNKLLIAIIAIVVIISLWFLYFLKTKNSILRKNKLLLEQKNKLSKIEIENKEKENKLLAESVKKQNEINRLQKIQYEKELKHKNRELASVTMHILSKNKILSNILNALNKLKKQPELAPDEINKIIKGIKNSISMDADWEQFKMHFDQVNKGFFTKLLNKHPGLTKTDLKLCAYLRMNLSTKEIAQMMNITVAGVHKSKNRLRKKLNIGSDVNITNYLIQF